MATSFFVTWWPIERLDFAYKLLDLGCYISASGIVTFKNSSELADTFKLIPNDRILVETDSPYLSPDPLRGKSNEPSHIIHTIRFLSKLKNLNENDLSKITTQNFFNLFGKLNWEINLQYLVVEAL